MHRAVVRKRWPHRPRLVDQPTEGEEEGDAVGLEAQVALGTERHQPPGQAHQQRAQGEEEGLAAQRAGRTAGMASTRIVINRRWTNTSTNQKCHRPSLVRGRADVVVDEQQRADPVARRRAPSSRRPTQRSARRSARRCAGRVGCHLRVLGDRQLEAAEVVADDGEHHVCPAREDTTGPCGSTRWCRCRRHAAPPWCRVGAAAAACAAAVELSDRCAGASRRGAGRARARGARRTRRSSSSRRRATTNVLVGVTSVRAEHGREHRRRPTTGRRHGCGARPARPALADGGVVDLPVAVRGIGRPVSTTRSLRAARSGRRRGAHGVGGRRRRGHDDQPVVVAADGDLADDRATSSRSTASRSTRSPNGLTNRLRRPTIS